MSLFIAPSIYVVVALRLIGGAAGALWNISRYAYLTDITSPHERGRTISIFGGVSRIGSAFGPAIGGLIASWTTLEGPFLLYGTIAAIAALIAAIAIEGGQTSPITHQDGYIRHIAVVFLTHKKSLLIAGTGQLFAQAIRTGRSVVIPLYGAEVLGLGINDIGVIMSVAGILDTADV